MEGGSESFPQRYDDAVAGCSSEFVNKTFFDLWNSDETELKIAVDEPHPLPAGKNYHLYVIHCSEDEDDVINLVQEMERRFSLKCMLHQRDFQPGVGILQNCQMKIAESEKVLVIISPEYFQAYWCQEELKCAKMWSYELKRNDLIIPLILRPVTDQLPPDLRFHTYINATKEDDLAKKVYDAFLFDEKAQTRKDLVKKNGFRLLEMAVSRISPKKLSGISWSFLETFESDEEVSDLYNKCAKELNASNLLRCHGILAMGVRIWLMTIAITVMLSLTLTGIHASFVIHYQNERLESISGYLSLGDYIVAFTLVGIPLGFTLWRRKLLLEADRLVWKLNDQNIEYECLALLQWNLLIHAGCLRLVIIRYDKTSCIKYLASMLKRKHPESDDRDIQETASNFVQNALFGAREHLLKCDTLKDVSINHHNTWKNKQCLCDMIAPMLEDPGKESVIITQ